jgi:hypothetical protein
MHGSNLSTLFYSSGSVSNLLSTLSFRIEPFAIGITLIAGSKDLRFITSLNDSELDRKSGIKF